MLITRFTIAAFVTLAVAGCNKAEIGLEPPSFSDNFIGDEKHKKVKSTLKAQVAYTNGDYGNAEKHYRKAVEKDPKNAEAWLGLAATYDRLKRFDNANKAYDIVIKLVGFTPTVLNNLGYHYILRGNYATARRTLEAAEKKDPSNEFIQNNIRLLENREAEVIQKEDEANS